MNSLRVFTVVLLALFAARARAGDESLNTRLKIDLLIARDAPAPVALKRSLVAGNNIQVTISVPGAEKPGGPLLDPNSVELRWNDAPIASYVYYKQPTLALVFALPEERMFTGDGGELSATARLLGSTDTDAGWRLPVHFDDGDTSAALVALHAAAGRQARITDESHAAIAGAFLFGQRHRDLFTRANAEGIVFLDAPNRNAPSDHFAWAEGYWPSFFDPALTPEVSLFKRDVYTTRDLDVRVKGAGAAGVLLLVDETVYIQAPAGRARGVEANALSPVRVTAIAAGFQPRQETIEPLATSLTIELKPLKGE